MAILTVNNIRQSFGEEVILQEVTFELQKGERVGLVGVNGSGKTTLFKVLTGEYSPDTGSVTFGKDTVLGYMEQHVCRDFHKTAFDEVMTVFAPLLRLERELEDVTALLAEHPSGEDMERLIQRQTDLNERFVDAGGLTCRSRARSALLGLGFEESQLQNKVGVLSGGQKAKLQLAKMLLSGANLLLLDEPTNHLDIQAVEWLESFLLGYSGSYIVISHDRYFLDKVVSRIIEIQNGRAEFYSGSYSFYAVEKERRYEEKLKQYEKEQAKIQQLEQAAQQLRTWAYSGMDKTFKRAQSMEKRIEKMRVTDRPKKERKMEVRFGEREFRGDEVLSIRHLAKSFGARTLFADVNLEVEGGERIALLGDNGTGKSTLLKLILGEEEPDEGKVRLGPTVKIGYLPQIIHFDHPERSLVDTMLYDLDCTAQTARNRLAAFKFRGEDVFKPVGALSGGEQSRLRLCMLMDAKINLLILDEPTNHLDIQSREWIEEAVEEYGGNLLFVSHDRYFIDRFATRIWMLEGGVLTDFKGTYQEYLAARQRQSQGAAPALAQPQEKKEKPRRPGGTKNLEKEVAAAERAVGKAEEEMYDLTREIEEASSDYLKLQELYEKREALEEEILKLYGTWESLSAQLEEARG